MADIKDLYVRQGVFPHSLVQNFIEGDHRHTSTSGSMGTGVIGGSITCCVIFIPVTLLLIILAATNAILPGDGIKYLLLPIITGVCSFAVAVIVGFILWCLGMLYYDSHNEIDYLPNPEAMTRNDMERYIKVCRHMSRNIYEPAGDNGPAFWEVVFPNTGYTDHIFVAENDDVYRAKCLFHGNILITVDEIVKL